MDFVSVITLVILISVNLFNHNKYIYKDTSENSSINIDKMGCDNNIGEILAVSDNVITYIDGAKTGIDFLELSIPKIIIHFNHLSCVTCELSHLAKWFDVLDYSYKHKDDVITIFLCSSNEESLLEAEFYIKNSRRESTPILLELSKNFILKNSYMNNLNETNVFLVDKSNKIILTGNPLCDLDLWGRYKSIIEKLSK